ELVQVVEQPVEGRLCVIALTGISGVGKDSLWDSIKDNFGEKRFVPHYSLEFSPEEYRHRKGHIFTTTTPIELARLNWRGEVVPIIVKGMNADEMSTYVTQFSERFGKLSQEQVVEYSLGIPLLAQRFFQNDGMTEKELALIAGSHLRYCVGGHVAKRIRENPDALDRYLSLPLNDDVRDVFETTEPNPYTYSFEEVYARVLERQAEIRQRYENNLTSPFFVSQESADLYADMITNGGDNPCFDLFAPHVSREQFQRIERELFSRQRHTLNGTRSDMFGAQFRKVGLWLEYDSHVKMAFTEAHPEDIQKYQHALREGELPLESSSENPGAFYLHSHDHRGFTINQLLIGMATETLLQHMAVEYIVDYGMAQKACLYDPKTNTLTEIPRFSDDILFNKKYRT
ncbi:TPA: hypothetical protein HA278_06510, partial [Candidatus Woesearchaeota archaeon]|nr:hypothetical protein [Candidatus Woesearchaeota archaeon]